MTASALDRALYDLGRTRVAAPAEGRVAPFEARIGDYAGVGGPVLALVTDANWRVVANITERHLGRLAPGQPALLLFASHPWRLHRGRVRSVSSAVARSPAPAGVIPYVAPQTDWVRLPSRFPVEIELGDPRHRLGLFRGSSVRVLIWF